MNIIFYTKEGCPWCDEVRELLQSKNVSFEERECRHDKKNFDELVQKSGQTLTPTLDVDGTIIADIDAKAVQATFREMGVKGF